MQSPGSARAQTDAVLTPLAKVSARHGIEPLAVRLMELRAWLADDLTGLEVAVQDLHAACADEDTGLPGTRVRSAAQHLLALPGKRIRPLCVLLAARLGGLGMDHVLRDLAVACELVHAATLLHDDVIDDSAERRGAPAPRMLYGNSASILAGDHLLVEALRLVQHTAHGPLLSDLLQVISHMVQAEALQLERRGRFDPDRAIYLEVIRGKTAALFAWGLRAGGTVAKLDAETLAALSRVGVNLGMAFQLVDDVLDLEGDPAVTGKEALVDIREGKLTWPIILAAERDPALRQELTAIAAQGGRDLDPERAHALVKSLRATGAIDATRVYAKERAAEACAELQALPANRARTALQLVVESAVHRMH
jgi:octaprenyl-diphosphate synthase